MVEAAFLMPIFVLFLFGIIEFSGFLLSKEGTGNTVQAGARTATVQGNDAMADQAILARMADEGAGIPNGEIKQIIIWHASGPNDTPSATCLAGTGVSDGGPYVLSAGNYNPTTSTADKVGACNVYNDPQASGGAFELAKGTSANLWFGCPNYLSPGQYLDCNWAPQHRMSVQQKPGTGNTHLSNLTTPDYVGIYIKAVHKYYTGLFGSSVTITDTSIGKIEPETFSTT
jgi:hypothetical protein